jgi:signal transduction histidine kinase
LKIDLGWVKENGDKANIKSKLDKMIATINGIIRKVQRISSELHPKLLTDLGLADAIEWYCGEQQERTGVEFELNLEEETHRNFQRDLALFRILQEALTNVIRHAKATKVSITVTHEKRGTFMTISDNGIGIDPVVLESSTSLGLYGMRERARQCNGNLELELNIPFGTSVKVFIPTPNFKSDETSKG